VISCLVAFPLVLLAIAGALLLWLDGVWLVALGHSQDNSHDTFRVAV
jgi:hypothetical protein